MSLGTTWIGKKYVGLVSGRLSNFKRKNSNFNFSCNVCGDSKKNRYTARAWILDKGDHLMFHCHNLCGSKGFDWWLKHTDENLYSEYRLEKFKESMDSNPTVRPKELEQFESSSVDKFALKTVAKKIDLNGHWMTKLDIKKLSSLPADHPAKKYVEARMFPPELHYRLYHTDGFKKFTNHIIKDKFENTEQDGPRILFPMRDREGILFGYSGRAYGDEPKKIKYIIIIIDHNQPTFFNMDYVDFSKPIMVLEGQFDALLLPNALASCGGSIITELPLIGPDKSAYTVVYDNEPRSRDTVEKMNKALRAGYKICVWPEEIKEKDVNEMYLSGISRDKIACTIEQNTFSGLRGYHALNAWKKI